MPEWWGLRVDGGLVRVIHWPGATPPALHDFGPAVLPGTDYEIAPLRAAPGDWLPAEAQA